MNKSRVCFAALCLFAALPISLTYAQQPSSMTLSCNGTSKLMATAAAEFKPDPITNLGIIVNFADRTVHVLGLRHANHERECYPRQL